MSFDKCTVVWPTPRSRFRACPSLHLALVPAIPYFPPRATTDFFISPVIIEKESHTVYLGLASLIPQNASEIQPCSCADHLLLPFYSWVIFHCTMFCNLLIPAPAQGRASCSQFGKIMNEASINVGAWARIFISREVRIQSPKVDVCLSSKETVKLFPKFLHHSALPPAGSEHSHFSTALLALGFVRVCSVLFLAILLGRWRYPLEIGKSVV